MSRSEWTKKYGEDYNRRRRERYNTDPNYRSAVRRRALDYASKQQAEGKSKRAKQGRLMTESQLAKAEYFAVDRQIMVDGCDMAHPTYSLQELADFLMVDYTTLYRWRDKGIILDPVYETIGDDRRSQFPYVYIVEEAEAIARVLLDHQQVSNAIHARKHADTIEQIHAGMEDARIANPPNEEYTDVR